MDQQWGPRRASVLAKDAATQLRDAIGNPPMKLATTLTRSLKVDMQARAARPRARGDGGHTRRWPRPQDRAPPPCCYPWARAAARQQLARQALPEQVDAASLVYTKAPQIIRAFDEGALIRSKRGRFLAIPTENAPRKGTDGKRVQPEHVPEHRFGPLRFVPRRSGPSLLVVDGLRGSVSRKTGELRGFRRATERARQSGAGLATVVMFLLVPQVKLPKRLDVARAAERWSAQLPALIEQQLRSE